MAPTPPSETLAFYAGILDEIKVRLRAVETELANLEKWVKDPTAFVHAEYCYLQIRFVCELVALAAIVAHQHSADTGPLLREWNADVIFKRLSEINEKCYPQAMTVAFRDGLSRFEKRPGAQLSRDQIQKIYGTCGDHLHRGRLKKGPNGLRIQYKPQQICDFAEAFYNLLDVHVIELPHVEGTVLAMLGGPDEYPRVGYAEPLEKVLSQSGDARTVPRK